MGTHDFTRRDFIKSSIGAGIAISGLTFCNFDSGYDAKGLPTVILGKTGVRVPRLVFGLGSRFCSMKNEDNALELLNYSLDKGLYYWDTAYIYEDKKTGIVSEEVIGKVLKTRRKEVFISTKVSSREPDEAMRQIEGSLKRLQVDQLDMLMLHSIMSDEDLAKVSEKGNLIDIVTRMKAEGVARFIGFSGHADAQSMKSLAEQGDFDTMIVAMNHQGNNTQPRQELAIPAALEKGMGIILMKVVRPKETIENIDPNELVRYGLSLDGPSCVVIGMESMDVVNRNLAILHNFKPMTEDEKKLMAQHLTPFYNHHGLEWMRPDYRDGVWG